MIQFPNIDPEIVRIGPLAIRWYGLMYLIGFLSSMFLVRRQISKRGLELKQEFIETLYAFLILGLLLGGRLGYIIFYNFGYYMEHPFELVAIWQGGMSFHGALAGTILAGWIYCHKAKVDKLLVADLVVATVPIGLGLGRIGNFINAELYGRVTDVPWAMIFPGEVMPRHPSQLYEFFLEGVVLFIILWLIKDRVKKGTVTALFLVLYGVFRSFVEFFREPDAQLGFIFSFLTMGQILSGIMIAAGILVYIFCRIKDRAGKSTFTALLLVLSGIFRIFLEFFREPDAQSGLIFGFLTMGRIFSGIMIIAGIWIYLYGRTKQSTEAGRTEARKGKR
jgi:phosphatidylglycerol---prolipoprotein diacylglyceryl transferase